ncbi:MAG: glucose-6-phosphate isomerase [Gammaproteobacteria bacterium CG11_big_fil_rev_8_21_14_0_20_46_22]|nr:MAG: glucose-6-phosphate isomerase [Gammaproteobacteria bacterium CG12_big_fil_rev_8_21_14_0_65_46_12]PIR11485.1 MAG: glucose-6-phosphate isomerase [Gammaproteobacteria bacterium CG11_big_fil_rev_8_21_14_0_20_46_22]
MINKTREWSALEAHAERLSTAPLANLMTEKHRFDHYSIDAPHWLLDFSRQRVDKESLAALIELAKVAKLEEQIQALFGGKAVNTSENRPALHTALRDPNTEHKKITETLSHMEQFCHEVFTHKLKGVNGQPITDIVNIGIGGSDLGPRFTTEALSHFAKKKVRCHFISNIDPSDLSLKLKDLNPGGILFIVSSKSFNTQETLINAQMAKDWLTHMTASDNCVDYQFVAVTANTEKAKAFGINEAHIFPTWDFVGGRFSLWSAVGLPIALSIGFKNFKQLLLGAHEMDQHFLNTPFENNLPVMTALLNIWQRNFQGINNQAIIPYSTYLERFVPYLQQLVMESCGKSVSRDGETLAFGAGPIIWGGVGSDSQHAFHQHLHQSHERSMIDFIGFRQSLNPTYTQQTLLFANMIAQADALALGRDIKSADNHPHRVMPGNRSSNLLLADKLTPESLGALIALYEHQVFTQSAIWGINPFDQFGVELGKTLANDYFKALESDKTSKIGAIEWFKSKS